MRYFSFLHLGLILSFCTSMAQAGDPTPMQSDRFILKLRGAVELSSTPSVRRLEKEGEQLGELIQANRLDAEWLRAGPLGTHVMRWKPSVRASERESLINRLRSDPSVEFVEADQVLNSMMIPNDVNYKDQWALQGRAGSAGSRFEQAWDITRGSASVVVAVVDTGVVYQTPELAGKLLRGYDFITDVSAANDGDGRDADASDPGDWITTEDTKQPVFSGCPVLPSSWHGTFIAAQIAGNTQNERNTAGADWNAKILPVRVSGKCKAFASDMYDGLMWAAGFDIPGVPKNTTPASVINVSLGGTGACSKFAQAAINQIRSAGALIVASAGNGGGDVFQPANCEGVMAVAALDKDGSRANYSAIGKPISIAAPGGYYHGILGVSNRGAQGPEDSILSNRTGTSFASPLVASAAALIKSVNSSLSGQDIKNILESTAQNFMSITGKQCMESQGMGVCDCKRGLCGAGMLDAHAAVLAAKGNKPIANAAISTRQSTAGLLLNALGSNVSQTRKIASYRWEQVSGAPVMEVASADPEVALNMPQSSSDLIFKLTISDTAGETHSSWATLRTSTDPNYLRSPSPAVNPQSTGMGSAPVSGGSAGNGETGGRDQSQGTPGSTAGSGSGGGGGGGHLSAMALTGLLLLMRAWRRWRT